MFNNLANYILGTIYNQQDETAGVVEETNLRLTSVSEDDWVLVDRDSEGNSELSSDEECEENPQPLRRPLTRTSSTSSLPCITMEESWFVTPPPCFTSAGPIHMETSPLENLLIEHPSMSVYQHSQHHTAMLVNTRPPARQARVITVEVEDVEEVLEEQEEERIGEALVPPRRNRLEILQRQEKQCLKNKQAQKVQFVSFICLKYIMTNATLLNASFNCRYLKGSYFFFSDR